MSVAAQPRSAPALQHLPHARTPVPHLSEHSPSALTATAQVEKAGGYSSADGKQQSALDVPIEVRRSHSVSVCSRAEVRLGSFCMCSVQASTRLRLLRLADAMAN